MAAPAAQLAQPETPSEAEAATGESRDREEAALAEPAAPEQPPDEQPPKELPKTASLYPLFGLSGAVLLGFAGLLRLKRSS